MPGPIRYTRRNSFVADVAYWSSRPYRDFPPDMAPCGYLPGADEENRVLARIFAEVCTLSTMTDRKTHLLMMIEVHDRRLRMGWDSARGHGDTRTMLSSDRSAMVRLKPYEHMVEVLRMWLDDLAEASSAELGVGFIAQSARRSA